jgi:hypothetical protein
MLTRSVTDNAIDLFHILAGEKYKYMRTWKYVLSNGVFEHVTLRMRKPGSASAHIAAHGEGRSGSSICLLQSRQRCWVVS